ncbi:hypothetical protein E8E12_006055 [Didymella heteroderae]|uniref:Uncharacterized protein n=1 Tax=Didymella heteroderae TaxID=1769908 RepID=A0A9P5BYR1_9PLEO|nr:hypothetical protein E8E12_006055 [Didymella heteroderae]
MAKTGVPETLESLGLKDHGTSGYRARAVFYCEPLLRLYKLEIPSLFGRLMRDEGIFLDRADPDIVHAELEELLIELGPLIWCLLVSVRDIIFSSQSKAVVTHQI